MKIALTIVIIIVLITGSFWFFSRGDDQIEEELSQAEDIQEEAQDIQQEEILEEEEESVPSAGYYGPYSEDRLALAEDGDVVLFFRASWCPTCRALDQSIQANAGEIPENVAILTLDYDTETALRQKYGVTIQHTLVQVDSEGNEIKKWSGGNTLESIVSRLD